MEASELKPAAERTVPSSCATHGDYQAKVVDLLGREIKTGCPTCAAEREAKRKSEEEAEDRRRREAYRADMLAAAGIVPRFQGKTLETYIADTQGKRKVLDACTQLVEHIEARKPSCPSLILCGKPGTGKTHLASGMTIRLALGGFVVRKINLGDLIRIVRETWGRGSDLTESAVYQGASEKDLLIIDEIGAQNGTDNEKLIIFEVMNRRYEACKPTVLISNLTPDQIKQELGDRVMDRLREDGGRMIACDWASERRGAA